MTEAEIITQERWMRLSKHILCKKKIEVLINILKETEGDTAFMKQ